MQKRRDRERSPEPLRLRPPLSQLPWDVAQSQFGVEGADFIGVMGTLLLRSGQSQFEAYVADNARVADIVAPAAAQSQIQSVAE